MDFCSSMLLERKMSSAGGNEGDRPLFFDICSAYGKGGCRRGEAATVEETERLGEGTCGQGTVADFKAFRFKFQRLIVFQLALF